MHARLNAVRLILAALISPGLIAGCADENPGASPQPTTTEPTGTATPTATPTVTPAGSIAPIRLVDEGDDAADLKLYVSNQSFADDPVHVTVTIDGVELIDQSFAVEGQHNWIDFAVDLPGGEHEIVATSDTGVEFSETFNSSPTKLKYAVLDYWNYEDAEGKYFSWNIQGTAIGFD
jgi:hypothetical protein